MSINYSVKEKTRNNEKFCIRFTWFSLKYLQKTLQCYIDFPNEIINLIMLIITPPIHPKNICPCNNECCIEHWNYLIGKNKLFYDLKIFHCNGACITVGTINYDICHEIVQYKLYRCFNCFKECCIQCIRLFNKEDGTNIKFTASKSIEINDNKHLLCNNCLLCHEHIWFINYQSKLHETYQKIFHK